MAVVMDRMRVFIDGVDISGILREFSINACFAEVSRVELTLLTMPRIEGGNVYIETGAAATAGFARGEGRPVNLRGSGDEAERQG